MDSKHTRGRWLRGRIHAERHLAFIAVLLLSFALIAAACGDDDDGGDTAGLPTAPDGSAVGQGISVPEALASTIDGPLLVNGFLISEDGRVRLCSAQMESYPPQCGGEFLEVAGDFSIDDLEGVQTEGSISWVDDTVQLLGTVDDGTLTVSGLSSS